MKTPREVLIEHHQAAQPKLDAIARAVIQSELRSKARPEAAYSSWVSLPWRELIWPYRRVWAGLAGVWLLIFVAQFSVGEHTPAAAAGASGPSREMMLAFWRQEGLLSELVEPRPARAVPPPKPARPQPRSQGRAEIFRV